MNIALGIIIFGVVLFVIIKVLKTDDKKLKEQEKNLDDELIYDPLTGRKLTLEEAENEAIPYETVGIRIKSDEEIEANYSDGNKEIEYIIRESARMELADNEDERIDQLIQNSDIFADLRTFEIRDLWRISNDDYIGLTYISSNYNHGRSDQLAFENQLIGIVQGEVLCDKIKNFKNIKVQTINQTTLFRVTSAAKFSDFLELVELITGKAR